MKISNSFLVFQILIVLMLTLAGHSIPIAKSEENPKQIITQEKIYEFSISPSGNMMGFAHWDADGYSHTIKIADSNGTIDRVLTLPEPIVIPHSLSWSPDEKWIFFIATMKNNATYDIWKIGINGANLTKIASDVGESGFSISPDGTRIAFAKKRPLTVGPLDLGLMNANGTEQITLFAYEYGTVSNPHWSPDGSKIVFIVDDGRINLWVINSDGSNVKQLTYDEPYHPYINYEHPRWSPDASKIGFSSRRDEYYGVPGGIWIINSNGTDKFPVTFTDETNLEWFPQGNKIAYIYLNQPPLGIWVLDLEGPVENYDLDGDGISNFEETIKYKTVPNKGDTDGDGIGDGVELRTGSDPKNWDTDTDGISDGIEFIINFGNNTIVKTLPEGYVEVQISWANYTLTLVSNSTVVGTTFNSTSRQIVVRVSGYQGTLGVCNMTVNVSLP